MIDAILPGLEQGQINNLQIPGLAYWRAIQVTSQAGQPEIARLLRQAFHRHFDVILEKLSDPASRDLYSSQLWYHRDLLASETDAQNPSTDTSTPGE